MEEDVVDPLRGTFATWPNFSSLRTGKPVPANQELMIFALDAYDPVKDLAFWRAVTHRIRIHIRYESIYGSDTHEAWFMGSPGHKVDLSMVEGGAPGPRALKDQQTEPSRLP